MTQVRTRDNAYIDLVLDYPEGVVVVEAKWASEEHHAAQTGDYQTVAYDRAMRVERRRPRDPLVVYLTPDGRAPLGIGVRTTHAGVALAVAEALDAHPDVDVSTREAFRIVLGHFLRHGAPVDLTELTALLRLRELDRPWRPEELRALLLAHQFVTGSTEALDV